MVDDVRAPASQPADASPGAGLVATRNAFPAWVRNATTLAGKLATAGRVSAAPRRHEPPLRRHHRWRDVLARLHRCRRRWPGPRGRGAGLNRRRRDRGGADLPPRLCPGYRAGNAAPPAGQHRRRCPVAHRGRREFRSVNAHAEMLLRRALTDAGRMPKRAGPLPRRGCPRANAPNRLGSSSGSGRARRGSEGEPSAQCANDRLLRARLQELAEASDTPR
jgi:hypothetical protein